MTAKDYKPTHGGRPKVDRRYIFHPGNQTPGPKFRGTKLVAWNLNTPQPPEK